MYGGLLTSKSTCPFKWVGSGSKRLRNVLVGDLWLFGRQTYVDISLGRTDEGKAAAARYRPTGKFRAIVIKTVPAKVAQADLAPDSTAGWMKVDGRNGLGMSGAAFYMGRDLEQQLNVPVGIVDVDMGNGQTFPCVTSPVQFDEQPNELRKAPEHAQDTETFLLEFGLDWDRIASLKERGAIA